MNLKLFFHEISVEPALFFYMCNYHLVEFFNKNLFIQKSCRFNRTLEPDLSTKCDDEENGILFASQVNSNYSSWSTLICIIYLIVAVCWSDKAGKRRRPLIFLPIAGQILQSCSGLVHSYFWSWNPSYAVITNLIGEIMGGSRDVMVTATQMYICDITNSENRTMRIGILWMVRMIGAPLGKGSSGFILRCIGFYYSYVLCIVLSLVSLIFGLISMKNTGVKGVEVSLRQIFNFTPILDSFRVVFRKNLANKRTIVVLLLLVQLFEWFSVLGENSVIYLFLRYKFEWDEKTFSFFQIFRYAIIAPGTLFCSVVLSKLMKIHDGVIGVFAAVCDTITVIGYMIAYESWHLYAVTLFDMFHGSALSVGLSFVSKFYESHEFGRLFAVIYVFGLFFPISLPLYNIVFQNTLKIFPSAYYLISIALNTGVVFLYWVSYQLDEKTSKEKPSEDLGEEQESMMTASLARTVNHQDKISP